VRALAGLVVAAFLVLVGALGAVLFLVRQHCGSDFGYYGCETPAADSSNEGHDQGHHVARAGP
jgi:hypothetical protein